MSEDSVKYEPLESDRLLKNFESGISSPEQWYTVGATGWQLTEYGKAQIRIEALRAAAVVATARAEHHTIEPDAYTLYLAKQFAAYLETGE